MLRTGFYYFLTWSYIILTLPVLLKVKYLERRGRTEERDRLADRYTMKAAKRLLWLIGASISVAGLENVPEGLPVLFVGNHQSHADSLIVHGFIDIPKGFVSIVEILNIPVLRTWMKYMKCVFIDRSDARQNVQAMETAVENLRQGRSMVIFPEGRVYEDGRLHEFRRGCLKLAFKTGASIVPVTLKNSNSLMNRDGTRIRPGSAECIIHSPISVKGYKKAEEAQLIERVRSVIAGGLQDTMK